ncbi:glutaminyl-tRNA synthetase [Atractiella rhizophila]|nr:glutaminyl-tRNA synthetase [Atractiella rhizophila]
MPPKKVADVDPELLELFKSINLSDQKATEAVRSKTTGPALKEVIQANDLVNKNLDSKVANLIFYLAANSVKLDKAKRLFLTSKVLEDVLKKDDQVNAAIAYLSTNALPVDQSAFEKECGVGVVISKEQIRSKVDEYFSSNAVALESGKWSSLGAALKFVRTGEIKWADSLVVKTVVEEKFTEVFGPKEAQAKPAKATANPDKKAASTPKKSEIKPVPKTTREIVANSPMYKEGWLSRLHKVGENPQPNEERRQVHLQATGGKVHTRFPPEPNGFLHIGHSKAITVNFGYAQYHGGRCYLRYDDTNPEAEEQVYIDSILEIIRWLGFEPFQITYSSDHFQELYELAVFMIKKDKGYVCHCTAEQMKEDRGGKDHRGGRKACVHRSRPVQESLDEFERMKTGFYKPGEAVLRMKMDLENPNPQMWDLVAYRVLDHPHPRTGSTWKMYPTYDFTHCLCDSFENITHSLCTTEFILSRESYEWLCDAVEVYRPKQSEYGRLSLEGTVMSKRKILKLVKSGKVSGWDDPRLYTLIALRRRGCPPQALIKFVEELGVTTAPTVIMTTRFEQSLRSFLELSTPRLMLVLHPIRLTLENLAEDYVTTIEKPVHPKDPSMGTFKVPFTREIFIDQSDFREVDSPNYFRLAPGKTVGLLNVPFPITCTGIEKDEFGSITRVLCRYEQGSKTKVKAYIHWVAKHAPSSSPVEIAETRIFKPLFTTQNPAASEDFMADINPNSLEVIKGSLLETAVYDMAVEGKQPEEIRFQGVRVAYFCLDKDSDKLSSEGSRESKIILNSIVSLKEGADKEES